jgi:transketolase
MSAGERRATREALGDTLVRLGEARPDIVVLDADLAKSTTTAKFAKAFPDRFFDCGVAEQNMMGTAAGLAAAGKVAFTGSFAVFATGRAYDQVRNTICYSKLPVKLCPTHAGISVGPDGGSHQMVEDISLMRTIPEMTVVVPADYIEACKAIEVIADLPGPAYVRLGRVASPLLFDDTYEFTLGRAPVMREGSDVTIVACGGMVAEALAAAEELDVDRVSAEVIDMSSIKPLDIDALLASASKTGFVVTAEEHSVMGGLGSACLEVLAERHPVPCHRVGVPDRFGTSGDPAELMEHYGLTGRHVAAAARRLLEGR